MMTAILILLCSMLSATHFISPLRDQDNGDIILVVQQDEAVTPAGAPRSIPFFAEHTSSTVLIGSRGDYGTVTIGIVSTAGDNIHVNFHTEDRQILLPISGDTGHYYLQISANDGTRYIGEFDL